MDEDFCCCLQMSQGETGVHCCLFFFFFLGGGGGGGGLLLSDDYLRIRGWGGDGGG